MGVQAGVQLLGKDGWTAEGWERGPAHSPPQKMQDRLCSRPELGTPFLRDN